MSKLTGEDSQLAFVSRQATAFVDWSKGFMA